MFGIGLGELVVIFIVVILFVNPKDLPGFFRKIGRFWAQLRSLNDKIKEDIKSIDKEEDSK